MARLRTPDMAAGEIHVSVSTVRRWIHEGRVPSAVRPHGRGIRIPAATLDALVRPVTPRGAVRIPAPLALDAVGAVFGPPRRKDGQALADVDEHSLATRLFRHAHAAATDTPGAL